MLRRRSLDDSGGHEHLLRTSAAIAIVDLSHNRIELESSALQHELFAKHPNCKVICLANNNVKRLSYHHCHDIHHEVLTVIDFSANQITWISEMFFPSLPALQTIRLDNNRISGLPESMGRLVHLGSLYLGNNQLSTLPDALCTLGQLETLVLSHNNIKSIPDCIYGLVSLRQLHLIIIKSHTLNQHSKSNRVFRL